MTSLDEIKLELQTIPWFRDLKIHHLDKIAQITFLKRMKAGEVLFREGDREDSIYVVLDGRIGLDMLVPPRGKVRFYTAEAWEIVGWSSVTPNVRQRTASASAVTDCLLAGAEADKLRQLCDQDYELGYLVMRRLANIVASRLVTTRLQLLDIFASPETENAK